MKLLNALTAALSAAIEELWPVEPVRPLPGLDDDGGEADEPFRVMHDADCSICGDGNPAPPVVGLYSDEIIALRQLLARFNN